MYAVFKTGGKQYRAVEGRFLDVETLPLDGDAGDHEFSFQGVSFVDSVGKVEMKPAKVFAKFLSWQRGPKLIVFKKNRRHNYRRKKGHRQDLMRIQITRIAV